MAFLLATALVLCGATASAEIPTILHIHPDEVPPQHQGAQSIKLESGGSGYSSFSTDTACVYFEDFESAGHGWTAYDPTFNATNADIYWNRIDYDLGDGGGTRGLFYCGTMDLTLIYGTTPGYGAYWDQRLDKSFTLPAGSPSLTVEHFYSTHTYGPVERDAGAVQISTDGGATYTTLERFSGESGAFLTSVYDLTSYAGQTVDIRLRFVSDYRGGDAFLNIIDPDMPLGGWWIESVAVSGSPVDDFEIGDGGWTASFGASSAPSSYRIEHDPETCADSLDNVVSSKSGPAEVPCGCFGSSWVAYDPVDGKLPFQDTDRCEVSTTNPTGLGIESPWIPIPTTGDILLRFDIFDAEDKLDADFNWVLVYYEVLSRGGDGVVRSRMLDQLLGGFFEGWHSWDNFLARNLTLDGLIAPGADSIKIRLVTHDMNKLGPIFGAAWTGEHGPGPFFDNVGLMVVGTPGDPADCRAAVCPFGLPVTVSGTVSSDCSGPLAGVTVDLHDGEGEFYTTTTDSLGDYLFADIPGSTNPGEVSIMTPLGFEPDSMVGVQTVIDLESDVTHDFPLFCLLTSGQARNLGYWKHEASGHLKSKGNLEETFVNMATNFPEALFHHFYENAMNGIEVTGVTFIDDPGGPRALNLQDMKDLLSAKKASALEKAKMEYLALLLNIASGKLMTYATVSQDGATASQALQYIAYLILDGDDANDKHAQKMGKTINNNQRLKAGEIPLGITQIAYTQRRSLEFSVAPNPGSRAGQVFAFTTYKRGDVRLMVYDVAGRIVATPVFQGLESGKHRIRWTGRGQDGRALPAGVYLARLTTPTSSATLKLMRVTQQ